LQADDVTASAPTTEQLRTALLALQKEPLPASPQEKEAYFMTQVSLGEQMAVQGESVHIYTMIMEKPTVHRCCLQSSLRPRLLQGTEGLPVSCGAHYAIREERATSCFQGASCSTLSSSCH